MIELVPRMRGSGPPPLFGQRRVLDLAVDLGEGVLQRAAERAPRGRRSFASVAPPVSSGADFFGMVMIFGPRVSRVRLVRGGVASAATPT